MKFRFVFLLIAALATAQRGVAQDNPELNPAVAQAVDAPVSTPGTQISQEREISWRLLVPNLLQDQRRVWMFPVSVAHGHHLIPTLAVLGITAALAVSDERIMKPVQTTQAFNGFNKAFSGFNTSTGMEVFPVVFYAIGLMRKDTYAQHTVLLAGEAVIDSEILTTVL